jgi:hypothetical protein
MKHQLRWFKNRIGKKIYRTKGIRKKHNECCPTCNDVCEHGLTVMDEQHAEYLHMVQYELNIDYADRQ